jgi:hypothetical protein
MKGLLGDVTDESKFRKQHLGVEKEDAFDRNGTKGSKCPSIRA